MSVARALCVCELCVVKPCSPRNMRRCDPPLFIAARHIGQRPWDVNIPRDLFSENSVSASALSQLPLSFPGLVSQFQDCFSTTLMPRVSHGRIFKDGVVCVQQVNMSRTRSPTSRNMSGHSRFLPFAHRHNIDPRHQIHAPQMKTKRQRRR